MTIVIDTAEKEGRTWSFSCPSIRKNLGRLPLDTGDFSVEGSEDLIRIERKAFDDLFSCLSGDLPRFRAQLKRLVEYEHHALLLDSSVEAILMGSLHCKLKGQEAMTRLMRLAVEFNIPPIFCGRHGAVVCQTWLAMAERKIRDAR